MPTGVAAAWVTDAAEVRLTLRREVRGRVQQRELGSRDVLTMNEAAAVLKRPLRELRQDIRSGFLRATRRKGHVVITVAACRRFIDEEREDGEAAAHVAARIRRRDAKLVPYEEVKKRLGWR